MPLEHTLGIGDHRYPPVGSNSGRKVFAHYIVGLTCGQPPERWDRDIVAAELAGLDGFALNIGPSDDWTITQLDHAYQAAERRHGGWKLTGLAWVRTGSVSV
ncbi:glycosyl hydrolase family 71-domain-containing protein [Corynascus similis CBS 632.67]